MKKLFIVCILLSWTLMSSFAEGLYFDIGLGVGDATTEVEGLDISDSFGAGVEETAVDLSLKLGYGPIGGSPFYLAGVLGGMGHRFYDSYNYIQFNSYLVGPGVIFYPVPMLQIAGSAGYSFVANTSDLGLSFLDSESGYAYDVSAALDLGGGNHGVLLGVKYFRAVNTLEESGAEEISSMVSLFVKYAYRHRLGQQEPW